MHKRSSFQLDIFFQKPVSKNLVETKTRAFSLVSKRDFFFHSWNTKAAFLNDHHVFLQ